MTRTQRLLATRKDKQVPDLMTITQRVLDARQEHRGSGFKHKGTKGAGLQNKDTKMFSPKFYSSQVPSRHFLYFVSFPYAVLLTVWSSTTCGLPVMFVPGRSSTSSPWSPETQAVLLHPLKLTLPRANPVHSIFCTTWLHMQTFFSWFYSLHNYQLKPFTQNWQQPGLGDCTITLTTFFVLLLTIIIFFFLQLKYSGILHTQQCSTLNLNIDNERALMYPEKDDVRKIKHDIWWHHQFLLLALQVPHKPNK